MTAFQYFIEGKGVANAPQKRALLLHSAGTEVQDLFEAMPEVDFVAAEVGEQDDVYKQAVRKLNKFFLPQVNVAYERHLFRQLKQENKETMDQFVSRLKQQAAYCEFGNTSDEHIQDHVIDACKSSHLRRKTPAKGERADIGGRSRNCTSDGGRRHPHEKDRRLCRGESD